MRWTAALEQERLQNAELRKQIEDMGDQVNNGSGAVARQIPRPQGTAGTTFSIQEAMGLSGSAKKYGTYKAIQVRCRHQYTECADNPIAQPS